MCIRDSPEKCRVRSCSLVRWKRSGHLAAYCRPCGGLGEDVYKRQVMSDALVAAAENAPGTVQAAAGLIRSFAAGVSKNNKRIYSAAVDIDATIGNALACLLYTSSCV